MRIGTKSVVFGAHQFWIHPFFVFIAWWRLYGFPWDPRLWVADVCEIRLHCLVIAHRVLWIK